MNLEPSTLPVWDNRHIYRDLDDPTLAEDLATCRQAIDRLTRACAPYAECPLSLGALSSGEGARALKQVCALLQQRVETITRLRTLATYAACLTSVDAANAAARQLQGQAGELIAKFAQAGKPLDVWLQRAEQPVIDHLLADPASAPFAFQIDHSRRLRPYLLPLPAEVLLTGLQVDGLDAWGELYKSLAGSLTCQVGEQSLGLAAAANLLRQGDRQVRHQAWQAINAAWHSREETAAAILNAINGWRLEEGRQRSGREPLHYLDQSCHDSRIERRTLDTLMAETWSQREIGRRALRTMARASGETAFAPWDILAPAPSRDGQTIPFDRAIDLIADAFAGLDPAMGEFARKMANENWIDARPSPRRSTGAYCTKFPSVREPRVFMTYDGSLGNVITLAHELGHAWHNWVMRDLSLPETQYPMTLAETASIFAETLVRDALWAQASDDDTRLEIAWQDAASAATMLLNIPTRYDFERALVERRKQGPLPVAELNALMADSWQRWYGDAMSEADPWFWASKLHFSLSRPRFYNYPYLFGYLFSLGIYAGRAEGGADFNRRYLALLRDTGRMSAESLVTSHLGQAIDQPGFWQDSLAIVGEKVARFEALVARRESP